MRQDVFGSQKTDVSGRSMARGKLTAETHGADETDVDDVVVAEADGAEVDGILRGHGEWFLAEGRRGEVYALVSALRGQTRGHQIFTCRYCSSPPRPFHRQ